MTNVAILNNTHHKPLRVIQERGPQYGDAVMAALTFPDEFRSVQSTYPIVFAPSPDGKSFDARVLFGFEQGENLFLGPDGWDAPVIPLSIQREPFLIGRTKDELSVHVDLDNPRVSTTRGEPVFMAYGGTSEYMERMTSVLRALHEGLERADGFMAALQELQLLEAFAVNVELADGSEHRLDGFYTIAEDRLQALSGEQLAKLARVGYLQPIYMAMASLSQFRSLIARRNARLKGA